MSTKTISSFAIAAAALGPFGITLEQQGRNRFTVRYGKQTDANLTYEKACMELGAAFMHQLACEGLIDNRMPGERS